MTSYPDLPRLPTRFGRRNSFQEQHAAHRRIGSAFEEERQSILSSGFDVLLHKPYTESQIHGILLRRLGFSARPVEGQTDAAPAIPDFKDLPPEWLAALKQANHKADAQAVEGIILQVKAVDPKAGRALKALSASFRFDLIEQTLSRAKE